MTDLNPYEESLAIDLAKAQARIEELEAKLAKAVGALQFYAKEEHYVGEYVQDACGCCGSWYEPRIHKNGEDSGDMARAALAAIQKEGGA